MKNYGGVDQGAWVREWHGYGMESSIAAQLPTLQRWLKELYRELESIPIAVGLIFAELIGCNKNEGARAEPGNIDPYEINLICAIRVFDK